MSQSNEVLMWHGALRPDGGLQPIVAASIPFDVELLKALLQTDRPGAKVVSLDADHHYMFAYDHNLQRPYPSVMIFRYEETDAGNIVRDLRQEDMRAVQYAYNCLLN